MECNQKQSTVSITKTLYENFLEEKCECDLLIPDYYPSAEKIIQCCATPVLTKKEVEDDHLVLEGTCRFTVIYQSEGGEEIKSVSESVSFGDTFPLKEKGNDSRVDTAIRISGTNCRLLNSKKISAKATVSIAMKVRSQIETPILDYLDCDNAEVLLREVPIYTSLEHIEDTVKVQGEIEVHTEIQDILKTSGSVCIKDVKIMPGKAQIKGILNLYLLFSAEEDPKRVEQTSTAIPFTQIIDLVHQGERAFMGVDCTVVTVRTDVEADDEARNRIISIVATLNTEGELYEYEEHHLLIDAYSNQYPLECQKETITFETVKDRSGIDEVLVHELDFDCKSSELLQVFGIPIIQKITGNENFISIEGILDLSLFYIDEDQPRSSEKVLSFTLKKELQDLAGHMRCEIKPCVLGIEWTPQNDKVEIKTEIHCDILVLSKETQEVISDLSIDTENPLPASRVAPVVVYYGERGERLWDIARKYATSVDKIRDANGLKSDVLLEKKLILIT